MKFIIFILFFTTTTIFPSELNSTEDTLYEISLSNLKIIDFLVQPIFTEDTFTNHEKNIHEGMINSLHKLLAHKENYKRYVVLSDIQKEQKRFLRALMIREKILRKRHYRNVARNYDFIVPIIRQNAFIGDFQRLSGTRRNREEESQGSESTEILDQESFMEASSDFSYFSSENNDSLISSASYSTIAHND